MKLAIMLGTVAGNAALRIPHQSPVERRGGVPYDNSGKHFCYFRDVEGGAGVQRTPLPEAEAPTEPTGENAPTMVLCYNSERHGRRNAAPTF